MKSIFFFISIIIFACGVYLGIKLIKVNSMVKETPFDVVKRVDEAFNRKDLEAVLDCYEDDAVVVIEPGKLAAGKIALKEFFETVFKFDGVAKQEKMKVIEASDLALFISKWQLTMRGPDGNFITKTYVATSVFRKNSAGQWRCVIDNSFGPAILEV